MNILVTGGAGYIGSHTVRALQRAGYTPVIVDNLSRGHVESIPEGIDFYNMDIADPKLVEVMKKHQIIGIMLIPRSVNQCRTPLFIMKIM